MLERLPIALGLPSWEVSWVATHSVADRKRVILFFRQVPGPELQRGEGRRPFSEITKAA